MARLNIVRSSSVHRVEASSDREVRASRQTLRTSRAALSPSPAQSSDKENQENERRSTSMDKGKDRTTNSSALPTPTSDASSRRQNKRMRIGEYSIAAPSAVEEASHDDGTVPEVSRVYDPDQAPQERRMNRKNMRDLSRRLNGTRHGCEQSLLHGY